MKARIFRTAAVAAFAASGLITIPTASPPAVVHAQAAHTPEPPRTTVDTTYVPPAGASIQVRSGDDLQSALDRAQPGDELVLEAGAKFVGNFTLKGKSGSGWINVRTSGTIPPEGTRVTPSNAASMPQIITSNSGAVLTAQPKSSTSDAAHHYRFIGIEFSSTSATTNLIKLGETGSAQSSLDQVPHHLILDRCYIHGTTTLNLRRGVALNSATTAIIDCYISECHDLNADSQAIAGWNGPGPFKIVNNYLEAAGENLMFGGADPSITNLIPSDIEFRRNHCYKPLKWKSDDPSYAGIHWPVKNLFELKNSRRVVITGNVFENVWLDAQTGFAVLFKSVNQEGTAPWSSTQDVNFSCNIVRHCGGAINIQGTAPGQLGGQTQRISICNNLFYDVSRSVWNGQGAFLQITDSVDIALDHNTVLQSGNIITAYGDPTSGFTFSNIITPNNQYGVKGDGTATGSGTLNQYFVSYVFEGNVVEGGSSSSYPAGNFFPTSLQDIGFVDMPSNNYRLSSSSDYVDAGTDGLDIGADMDAIDAAMSGGGGSAPPPASDPPGSDPSGTGDDIVLYAAEASIAGNSWKLVRDSTAAGGLRIKNPDYGAPKIVDPLAKPSSYFELKFNADAGVPYRLWIRGEAKKNSPYNDSVHVQFSDSVALDGSPVFRIGTTSGTVVNLEDWLNCGLNGWGWQDNGWGVGVLGPLIYFQNGGTHTIRIQVREDGFSIDQVVLSGREYLLTAPGALKKDTTILPK